MCNWQFNLIKRSNQDTSGTFFHRKTRNMVQLGINFVENAEMIYRWDLLQ